MPAHVMRCADIACNKWALASSRHCAEHVYKPAHPAKPSKTSKAPESAKPNKPTKPAPEPKVESEIEGVPKTVQTRQAGPVSIPAPISASANKPKRKSRAKRVADFSRAAPASDRCTESSDASGPQEKHRVSPPPRPKHEPKSETKLA